MKKILRFLIIGFLAWFRSFGKSERPSATRLFLDSGTEIKKLMDAGLLLLSLSDRTVWMDFDCYDFFSDTGADMEKLKNFLWLCRLQMNFALTEARGIRSGGDSPSPLDEDEDLNYYVCTYNSHLDRDAVVFYGSANATEISIDLK